MKEAVKKGSPDALSKVDFHGEVISHPVCKSILSFLTKKLKGKDIRDHFTAPPYGWGQDAIDGALLVLLKSNHITAQLDGKPTTAQQLDATKIGVCEFSAATIVLSVDDRLELKQLLQMFAIQFKQNTEVEVLPQLMSKLQSSAQAAGGDPPAPAIPVPPYLLELAGLSDLDLAQAVLQHKSQIIQDKQKWENQAKAINQRLPFWTLLSALKQQADISGVAVDGAEAIAAISSQRQLLNEPDPVAPLLKKFADALRYELNDLYAKYEQAYQTGVAELKSNQIWQQLSPEKEAGILNTCSLTLISKPVIGTEDELLTALRTHSLASWVTTTDALGARFSKALKDATALVMPAAVQFRAPAATLRTAEEVEAYVSNLRTQLLAHMKEGKHVVVQP